MKKKINKIIIIIIVVYFIYNTIINTNRFIFIITKDNNLQKININNNLKNILKNLKHPITYIQGSVHGNEPAGTHACLELLKNKIKFKKGTIIIFPRPNPFGLFFNTRYQFNFNADINRNFINNGKCFVSKKIIEIVKISDFIVDSHEGYGYYNEDNDSIGSSLSPTTDLSEELSNNIVDGLNKNIKETKKKFSVNYRFETCDIKSSLRCFCDKLDKDYILIETTGQRNIQPLDLRVKQMIFIMNKVIKKINN